MESIYEENTGFQTRKFYNHFRDLKLKELECGDAQAVLEYFQKMQASNSQFFYAIQMYEKGRAVNFFWVDARSRAAYHSFGDVIAFDTAYRTNTYNMPFAPFTGVNHHMQTIQFGCALLQDESEVTFTWLFTTWLRAMGGCPPVAILTDQDLAMKGSIVKVFPNTCHRLCIWHIMKKLPEKLPHLYHNESNFSKEIKQCIWGTFKKEEFEERWNELMKKYRLESNDWLKNLYDIREMWVPVYNRGTFFAGMNTTGRSEGVNSFLDDFVDWRTTLREFVVKYNKATKRIVKRENDEDYVSEHKRRIIEEDDYLLKYAGDVYTRNVFNKFKVEMKEARKFKVEEVISEDGNEFQSFTVKSRIYDPEKFTVMFNLRTQEGRCECQHFEFVGILCRHFLKVFLNKDIDTIPDHFILPRWRQKANEFRYIYLENLIEHGKIEGSETLRFSQMIQQASRIACLASPSYERSRIFTETMNMLVKRILEIPLDMLPPEIAVESV